jgi:hypothetical protein
LICRNQAGAQKYVSCFGIQALQAGICVCAVLLQYSSTKAAADSHLPGRGNRFQQVVTDRAGSACGGCFRGLQNDPWPASVTGAPWLELTPLLVDQQRHLRLMLSSKNLYDAVSSTPQLTGKQLFSRDGGCKVV